MSRLSPKQVFARLRTPQMALDNHGPMLCGLALTLLQIAAFFPFHYWAVYTKLYLFRPYLIDDFGFYLAARAVPAFFWGSHLGEVLRMSQHHWIRGRVQAARSNLIHFARRNTFLNAAIPLVFAGYQLFLNWQYQLPTDWRQISLVLLWGMGFNMVFQIFLLCWLIGLCLPKSAQARVQITETVRL